MSNVNLTGYLRGYSTSNNAYNIIPSNNITTNGMKFPILANGIPLYPNTGNYKFNTSHVFETPLYKSGGLKQYQEAGIIGTNEPLLNININPSDTFKQVQSEESLQVLKDIASRNSSSIINQESPKMRSVIENTFNPYWNATINTINSSISAIANSIDRKNSDAYNKGRYYQDGGSIFDNILSDSSSYNEDLPEKALKKRGRVTESDVSSNDDNNDIVQNLPQAVLSQTDDSSTYNFKPEDVSKAADSAYNYFINAGYSPQAAAGIVGNIKHESNFNTSAIGDGGKAKGYAQWHPARYNPLSKMFNLSTHEGNLQAMDYEIRKMGLFDKVNSLQTPEQAAYFIDKKYEKSAGLSTKDRINTAINIHKKFSSSSKFAEGGMYVVDSADLYNLKTLNKKFKVLI